MSKRITVVGAANVDIIAAPLQPYRPCESNPSRVTIGFGGVGRNIAHNLRLLGHEVRFVTVFGSDAIAHTLLGDCRKLGMMVEPVVTVDHARSNYFVCINDEHGEMQAGAADMELMDALTPELLAAEIAQINQSDAVVVDCNVSSEALLYLCRQCTVPLYVDGTSMAKSMRMKSLLNVRREAPLIVKLNRAEAQALTGVDGATEAMAQTLIAAGVTRCYITLGADGVFCANRQQAFALPAKTVRVVNATGAGDAFMAAVVHAELNDQLMTEVAAKGLKAAALALQCPTAVSKRIRQIAIS